MNFAVWAYRDRGGADALRLARSTEHVVNKALRQLVYTAGQSSRPGGRLQAPVPTECRVGYVRAPT